MSSKVHSIRRSRFLPALALLPFVAAAQVNNLDLRLPWDIDAESTSFDGKTSMIIFSGLRLSQGRISVEADEGRATNAEGEDGSWRFTGNVIIDVENGHIECDSANLTFVQYQLRQAVVTGSPATFELKRPGSDEITYAEAGSLSYDVDAGIIEFSEEATINEGGNQISSNYLVYNIAEQRINADSSGSDDGRVRITYTPTNGNGSETDGTADSANSEGEDENP
ncbi:MAG: lipopolysaccharide transport periplasmic protein LptA [Gammaproteobacteria bacterium]|nr:lipopolysaccharide transport periplasmic protein LptA [Gammaproteobacteria bacterium]